MGIIKGDLTRNPVIWRSNNEKNAKTHHKGLKTTQSSRTAWPGKRGLPGTNTGTESEARAAGQGGRNARHRRG